MKVYGFWVWRVFKILDRKKGFLGERVVIMKNMFYILKIFLYINKFFKEYNIINVFFIYGK